MTGMFIRYRSGPHLVDAQIAQVTLGAVVRGGIRSIAEVAATAAMFYLIGGAYHLTSDAVGADPAGDLTTPPTDVTVPDPTIPEPKSCTTYAEVTYYYDSWIGGIIQRGHASAKGWVTCTPPFFFAEVNTHVGITPGGQHNATQAYCLGGSTCTTAWTSTTSGRIQMECAFGTASAVVDGSNLPAAIAQVCD